MTFKYHQRPMALMVDDDVEFANLVRRILRTLDIDLVVAEGKIDFLRQLKQVRPHFCLIDLNLGGSQEGFGIIQATRAAGVSAPLFVVSADNGLDAVTHALEIGATDYFTKPLNRDLLGKKLSYHLRETVSANSAHVFSAVNPGSFAVQIEFQMQLDSVDEFGIHFRSPHLIPKGTLVKLSGEMILELTGEPRILTSIMSNCVDTESQLYGYYAEYEEVSEASLNQVRKWIGIKLSKQNQ